MDKETKKFIKKVIKETVKESYDKLFLHELSPFKEEIENGRKK